MKKIIKKKLILVLLERKLILDQKKAEAFIMGGRVKVENKIIDKPSTLIDSDSNIEINDGINLLKARK